MNADIQKAIIEIEKELANLKTAQNFNGKVQTYLYEAFDTTTTMRIYYDNPEQIPITMIMTKDNVGLMALLGGYDDAAKSQLVFFSDPHDDVVFTSTQPISIAENIDS